MVTHFAEEHGLGESFVDVEVKRALKNVASIEEDDVLFFRPSLLDDRGNSGKAAVSLASNRGWLDVRVEVIAMQNGQRQRSLRKGE